MTLKKEPFGRTPNGKAIDRYTISNYAWTQGQRDELGSDPALGCHARQGREAVPHHPLVRTPEEYEKKQSYLGSTVGRFANRSHGGAFTLDGKTLLACLQTTRPTISTEASSGSTGSCGGPRASRSRAGSGVRMRYRSRDGEEGYPGNLRSDGVQSHSPRRTSWPCSTTRDRCTHSSQFDQPRLLEPGGRRQRDHRMRTFSRWTAPATCPCRMTPSPRAR